MIYWCGVPGEERSSFFGGVTQEPPSAIRNINQLTPFIHATLKGARVVDEVPPVLETSACSFSIATGTKPGGYPGQAAFVDLGGTFACQGPHVTGAASGSLSREGTVAFWMKSEKRNTVNGAVIFQVENQCLVGIDRASGALACEVAWWEKHDGEHDRLQLAADAVTASTWCHVCFVWGGGPGRMRGYVNGQDCSSDRGEDGPPRRVDTDDLQLGSFMHQGSKYATLGGTGSNRALAGAGAPFYGLISDFHLLDIALTERNVKALRASRRSQGVGWRMPGS